jgi:hypothetical protein
MTARDYEGAFVAVSNATSFTVVVSRSGTTRTLVYKIVP